MTKIQCDIEKLKKSVRTGRITMIEERFHEGADKETLKKNEIDGDIRFVFIPSLAKRLQTLTQLFCLLLVITASFIV